MTKLQVVSLGAGVATAAAIVVAAAPLLHPNQMGTAVALGGSLVTLALCTTIAALSAGMRRRTVPKPR